jgi:RNA polymerase sigma-70 factor, ECF subfamily
VERESQIIADILSGDFEAYGALVRAHQARVRLACLARLANREEADDAAQEVFVKAFQALPRFKGGSSFLTWILSIADNHCLDLLRLRSRRHAESLDALLEIHKELFEALLSRSTAEEALVYTPEELELIGKLWAAIPPDDRNILMLREMEELSYEEIARRLDCTVDAVKGRLKRARRNLTEKCGGFLKVQAT